MFKKPLSNIKTSAPLRNSDRRKLKQRVIQAYGISPELGDLLVPDGLMSQKVVTYSNDPGVLYLSSEGDPLWFTIGKGADDLIPTVYTLWKKYNLLPRISTPEAVIPILVRGADLMIPGVVQVSTPTVLPQQLVSIVQHTDGSTSTCGPPLAVGRLAVDSNTLKTGAKGKAVHVLQTWKDHLFDMGNKVDPPGEMELKEDEGGDDDAPQSEPSGDDERQETVPDDVATDPNRTNGAASNALPPAESLAPASVPQISTSAPSEPVFSKEGKICPGRSYAPTETPAEIKQEKREKREEEERSKVREMEVKELWKPHAASGSAKFFIEGGFDSSVLYSYSELKSAVNKYVDARQLTNPQDRSYVNVGTDEVLLSTVCAKGEAPESVEFLRQQDIVQRLSENMQSWYEVQAEGKDAVLKKGQLTPISVVVKVRQGRKASTLVTGFEPFFLEGEEMADELRRLCACATSVSPAPGKASGLEVLVQGKQIKAVTEFLLSRGVPKRWIEAAALKGKK
ncbi:hypothetical protein OG21DRAFT_1408399 [Imleria badia]|nr:hypothetical protein OG21DRAFT_1408399 [Imleria badia]